MDIEQNKIPETLQLDEFEKMLSRKIMTFAITTMLENGELKESELEDEEYVYNRVIESDVIDKMQYHVTLTEKYVKSVEREIYHKNYFTATIITHLTIENMINMFYRDYLELVYIQDLNTIEEISHFIRNTNFPEKIGKYFNKYTDKTLNNRLYSKLIKINNMRNRIVHYQAIPEYMSGEDKGSYSKLNDELTEKFVHSFVPTIRELEIILERTTYSKVSYLDIAQNWTNQR